MTDTALVRTPLPRRFLTWLEGFGARAVLGLFGLLPLDLASTIAGKIARFVGPRVSVSRIARYNLRRTFPEKSDAERERIVSAMWEHVGRVLAEYAHLDAFRPYEPGGRVEVIGAENVARLRDDGKPGIFFSAHLGNWEVASIGVRHGRLPIALIYRAPNNPYVNRLIQQARKWTSDELLAKGAEGGRRAIEVLREGGHLGMLVDQKMNDGIAAPFFGRPAMTAPALARLAFKFDCPIVPTKVERLKGSHFRLTFYPPMPLIRTGDRTRDVLALTTAVNAMIEGWIRERPEQWLWMHRRWPE